MRDTDTVASIRQAQKNAADSQVRLYSARVAQVERLRPWAGTGAVLGTLAAAIGRAIPGPWGLGVTIAGAAVGAMGGALVVWLDYRKLEIAQQAREAHERADQLLVLIDAAEERTAEAQRRLADVRDNARQIDGYRLARIEALRVMVECIEAALLKNESAATTAQTMLRNSFGNLQRATAYEVDDFLTFTIFERRDAGGIDKMMPIARAWSDRAREASGGRSWARGEGYSGVLWSLAEDNRSIAVVEPDTDIERVRQLYWPKESDPALERQYRSVASFPIRIRRTDSIWGVVTATSSRVGVFDHQGVVAQQAVEAVRDVALIASLLVGLDRAK